MRELAQFPSAPSDPDLLEDALTGDDLTGDEPFYDAVMRSPTRIPVRRWFAPKPTMFDVAGPPAAGRREAVASPEV